MNKLSIISLFTVITLGLLGARAWAVELVDFNIEDQGDKVLITTQFSEPVEPEIISDYINWRIVFEIGGLQFTKRQLKSDHHPQSAGLTEIIRFLRFQQTEDYSRVGIYLGKGISPADARIEATDDLLTVELWKPVAPERAAAPTDEWPAYELGSAVGLRPSGELNREPDPSVADPDPETPEPEAADPVEDESAGDPTAVPVETAAEPGHDSLDDLRAPGGLRDIGLPREPITEPGETATDEPPLDESEPAAAESAPVVTEPEPETPAGTPGFRIEPEPAEEEPIVLPAAPQPEAEAATPARVERPMIETPPYTMFDIDDVAVGMLELKGMPFDEALMALVADSGFNVVIGDGIEDTEVNLNFTKKGMTLKNALDVLSIAYDLAYTVQDDAIIIKRK